MQPTRSARDTRRSREPTQRRRSSTQKRDGPLANLASFVAVTLVVLVFSRNRRVAAAVLGALVLGVACLLGSAAALGDRLNYVSFIAIPITLGIGCEYPFNLADRARLLGGDVTQAVARSSVLVLVTRAVAGSTRGGRPPDAGCHGPTAAKLSHRAHPAGALLSSRPPMASSPSPLGLVILAWLFTRRKGTGTRAHVRRATLPFVSDDEERLEREVDALTTAKLVTRSARGTVTLTAPGREAVTQWVNGGTPRAETKTAPREGQEDLGAFASRVIAAARASKTGRYGHNKVFISHVWRGLDGEKDAAAFKERLVAAHREGLIDLSRADLVEAMSPEDVAASETTYFGATFHFVRMDAPAPASRRSTG